MLVIFESHSTTEDNRDKLSSGWYDAALIPLGEKQSLELGERYDLDELEAVYTADLQRGYRTAELAFPGILPTKLFKDWRLRECDYGDLTRHPVSEVEVLRVSHIKEPFPNGLSYEQMAEFMGSFLEDLRKRPFSKVLIIGSRATHYGLEHHINGRPLEECVATKFVWQPGWEYELK